MTRYGHDWNLGENSNEDHEQRYQRTIEHDVRPKRLRPITPQNIFTVANWYPSLFQTVADLKRGHDDSYAEHHLYKYHGVMTSIRPPVIFDPWRPKLNPAAS
jgi:hypothetical protein